MRLERDGGPRVRFPQRETGERIRFVHVKRLDLAPVSDDVLTSWRWSIAPPGMGCHRQGDGSVVVPSTMTRTCSPSSSASRWAWKAGVLKGVHQVVGLAGVVLTMSLRLISLGCGEATDRPMGRPSVCASNAPPSADTLRTPVDAPLHMALS